MKKSPRTVHIDVYCTGSEAEDSSSSEASPPSSIDNNIFDDESNSTPQTVLDATQMNFRHSRVTNKNDFPRRIANQILDNQQISPGKLRQYLIENSTSKDEITESKQMLFSKHMGGADVQSQSRPTKFNFNKTRFRNKESDDGLSSNYPNSSRSTVRDITCSSISSAMASSSAIYDDYEWKETDSIYQQPSGTSLAASDSFEYENAADRARIRQMEQQWQGQTGKGWRSPEKERRFLLQQRKMIEFMHQNEKQMMEKTEDELSDNVENVRCPVKPPRTFIYNNITKIPKQCCANEREVTVEEKHKKILFTPRYSPSSQASTVEQTPNLSIGQINDHWSRARKFGALNSATRKTGRHFGPAKNPDCQCDHCRRWMAEREQCRGRALSLGDEPYNRSIFWLSRHQL